MGEEDRQAPVKIRDTRSSEFKRDWRKLNTGRLLYEGFELYNSALLKSLKPVEFSGIRNTHLNLLRHLDADGTRMSDLATRSNLTKAAITSLVGACKGLDLVTVEQSAGDARERLVRFSPKGQDLMKHIEKTIRAIERRLNVQLGEDVYAQLRSALMDLSDSRDALFL